MTQPKKSVSLLVTAAIIRDGNRCLIAQRKPDTSIEPNKWEFPGGKVEFGEHPESCLAREIREELDLEIEVERLHSLVSHVYETQGGNVHVILLCYMCRYKGGEPRALDVQDARWVSYAQLRDFEFAAADEPVVSSLLSESSS